MSQRKTEREVNVFKEAESVVAQFEQRMREYHAIAFQLRNCLQARVDRREFQDVRDLKVIAKFDELNQYPFPSKLITVV